MPRKKTVPSQTPLLTEATTEQLIYHLLRSYRSLVFGFKHSDMNHVELYHGKDLNGSHEVAKALFDMLDGKVVKVLDDFISEDAEEELDDD